MFTEIQSRPRILILSSCPSCRPGRWSLQGKLLQVHFSQVLVNEFSFTLAKIWVQNYGQDILAPTGFKKKKKKKGVFFFVVKMCSISWTCSTFFLLLKPTHAKEKTKVHLHHISYFSEVSSIRESTLNLNQVKLTKKSYSWHLCFLLALP